MRKRRRENKNRQKRKVIESTANYLIDNLKREGIVIQKYESMGTLSIYLKLDYGVLNSIRISDHKGKKHLSYKYNILTICPKPISTRNKTRYGHVIRHYFPMNKKQELFKKILQDRSAKILSYGQRNYQKFMDKQLTQNRGKKGFWRSSKIV